MLERGLIFDPCGICTKTNKKLFGTGLSFALVVLHFLVLVLVL